MSLKIPVAHDFACSWCYIGLFQVERLKSEFDVEIEWRGYELWPESMPWPVEEPVREMPNRPPTPTRYQLMLALEGLHLPKVERPKRMRTHLVHLAAEFAREHGLEGVFIPEATRAYWERGELTNELEFLRNLGERIGLDPEELTRSVEEERFAERIVAFDAPAYKGGVFNLPTFFIGGERYAQQPFSVLAKAVAEATK